MKISNDMNLMELAEWAYKGEHMPTTAADIDTRNRNVFELRTLLITLKNGIDGPTDTDAIDIHTLARLKKLLDGNYYSYSFI